MSDFDLELHHLLAYSDFNRNITDLRFVFYAKSLDMTPAGIFKALENNRNYFKAKVFKKDSVLLFNRKKTCVKSG